MIVYKAGEERVESVVCETPGYPNRDVNGEVMYHNTHFEIEAEAWQQTLAEAEARLVMAARRVEALRKKLAEASLIHVRTRNNYQDWKWSQNKKN